MIQLQVTVLIAWEQSSLKFFNNSAFGRQDIKKTIKKQLFLIRCGFLGGGGVIPPHTLNFSPWKFNSIIQCTLHLPSPSVHTHIHAHDGRPTVWFMDCNCCMCGICFLADSWLVSPATTCVFDPIYFSLCAFLIPTSFSGVVDGCQLTIGTQIAFLDLGFSKESNWHVLS